VIGAPVFIAAGAPAHEAIVRIKDIAFHPQRLEVRRSTRVTWHFNDVVVTHNVHSTGALRFDSSRNQKEGAYSVTFRRPGGYRYKCTLHPNMEGRVVVGTGSG
jgi:plastocyanin